jgi:adenylate cyclase
MGEPGQVFRALRAGAPAVPLPVMTPSGRIADPEPIGLSRLSTQLWRVDFTGPAGSFTAFPGGPLVKFARSGVTPDVENPFRGRIVLVGATFQDSREVYPTPVGPMPGIEIQANMVHTLLSRRALLPPHWALNLLFLTGACLTVALLSFWLRPVWVVGVVLALMVAFVAFSYEAYSTGGYWLDFVAPVFGMLAYLQGVRWLDRRRLRTAFGQYVSPEVMDRVLREGAELGGEVRTVSVLMSDLRGFTPLSERLSPAEVSAVMNEYFTAMVDVILRHRGTIQDFIGDAILAVFGAPVEDRQHPWHAVATAAGMQQALERLNAELQQRDLPALAMGIAVNTGQVFAGNVGAPRKKKYAVIGDTVNTVSRMEGLNRELGTRILMSETTWTAVKEIVTVKDRGAVSVRGKKEPVQLYELLEIRGPVRARRFAP